MQQPLEPSPEPVVVVAIGEAPRFRPGERVRIQRWFPIGHYRVPVYLRGRTGIVESEIRVRAVDNEQEGFGRNAGGKRYYYRIRVPLSAVWAEYDGPPGDTLHVEVHEEWLARAPE